MEHSASYALRSESSLESGDDDPSRQPRAGGADAHQKPGFGSHLKAWLRPIFRLRNGEGSLREIVDEAIEEHQEETGTESLDAEGRAMLHNVLALNELTVDDIMTPRANMVAIPADATLKDIKALIEEKEHTRMPVYRETLDQVTGFVHIKDILPFLGARKAFSTDDVLRQLIVVPPSMRVPNLLLRMRKSGVHMALVVDEYGGTDGLVTLEDIFEHIVGDILDEHDDSDEEREIVALSKTRYDVLARTRIEDLEEATGLTLALEDRQEDFDTLGGLLFTLLGKVPEPGEVVTHPHGPRFEILEADPRRIHKVRLETAPT